jgi:two-component SAPR family response regulator
LRKALEEFFGQQVRQHYLVLEKGILALRHIQIDQTLMFELMSKARYHWQRGNDWQAEQALWKVEQLWHGEFLAGFNLIDELLSRAEQLNQLRLEQLELLAQLLQKRQQYAGAIKILRQGLLLDPTRDAMVRRLLSVYRVQQDHRSAGILLEKYRTALKKEEYEEQEIAELIDALGLHWLTHRQ